MIFIFSYLGKDRCWNGCYTKSSQCKRICVKDLVL